MLTAKTEKAGTVIAALLSRKDMDWLRGRSERLPGVHTWTINGLEVYCVPGLKQSVMLYDDGTTLKLENLK